MNSVKLRDRFPHLLTVVLAQGVCEILNLTKQEHSYCLEFFKLISS